MFDQGTACDYVVRIVVWLHMMSKQCRDTLPCLLPDSRSKLNLNICGLVVTRSHGGTPAATPRLVSQLTKQLFALGDSCFVSLFWMIRDGSISLQPIALKYLQAHLLDFFPQNFHH